MRELVIDSFAGGGGASLGIEKAIGRPVDIAINHNRKAIAMHQANHPETRHYQEDVWHVDPVEATKGQPVALAWFSPDCTHFSRARGGRPKSKKIRGLAWVALRWAALVRPRVIMLENVEEFQTWGPLPRRKWKRDRDKGKTFARFLEQLRALGYEVETRSLKACDYGAPTIRRRFFMIARCDGQRIRWPQPTHGKGFDLLPYRTAADCIDFSLPCPSIFLTKEEGRALGVNRPLVDATMRRIAAGMKRFVIDNPDPFVVPFTVGVGGRAGLSRPRSVGEPTATGTAKADTALVVPYLAGVTHQQSPSQVAPADAPLRTITTSKGGEWAVVAPTLVQTGYGERDGQAPRALDIEQPLGTIVGGGGKHALVAAFLAKHFTGVTGAPLLEPMPTVTGRDHNALVTSNLVKLYGTSNVADPNEPMPTVTGGGNHLAEVRAYLHDYYRSPQDGMPLDAPVRTQTSHERFALVYVAGMPYAIADIGMRMLTPRELFAAQGFPAEYVIDPMVDGKRLTQSDQIQMCGNSVCPDVSEALAAANVGALGQTRLWAGYELAAGGI